MFKSDDFSLERAFDWQADTEPQEGSAAGWIIRRGR